MKLTMAAIGSTGDVRPYVLLGRELAGRGHEVTVAAFPRFEKDVTGAGLRFRPLPGDAERFISAVMQPDRQGADYYLALGRELKAIGPDLVQGLLEVCRGANAIICSFFGTVFYSIAEKLDIPCIQTQFWPMDPTEDFPVCTVRQQNLSPAVNRASYKACYLAISTMELYFLPTWRRANGMAQRRLRTEPDYRIGTHTVPVIYAVSPVVLPRPAEWGSHIYMSGFWYDERPCDWTPPGELADFLARGETPISIGFGSMNAGDMDGLMHMVLGAVRAAGLRAVISLGWSGQKPEAGDDVCFVDYVPHDWLLPRVRAVVHHGGMGTMAAALRCGKPALVVPFSGDQPFWGGRVRQLGCGPAPIPRKDLTEAKLTDALKDLVSRESYAANAARIGSLLQQEHGTAAAADIVERVIAQW